MSKRPRSEYPDAIPAGWLSAVHGALKGLGQRAARFPLPLLGRTARYTTIGAICAAANAVVMIVGDWAGGHYVPMSFVAFALVTPLGYILQAGFTFQERYSWRGFFRFSSGIAAGFPLSLLSMAILCSGLHLPVVLAAPATTVLLFIWNFLSAHWAIQRSGRRH